MQVDFDADTVKIVQQPDAEVPSSVRLEQIMQAIGQKAQNTCRSPSQDRNSISALRRMWLDLVPDDREDWMNSGH